MSLLREIVGIVLVVVEEECGSGRVEGGWMYCEGIFEVLVIWDRVWTRIGSPAATSMSVVFEYFLFRVSQKFD